MKTFFFTLPLILLNLSAKAQNYKFEKHHFTHDIGVFIGVYSIQTDYGPRQNFQTEIGNAGISLNLVHYLSFYNKTSRWNARHRFIDNLVIKSELSYLSTTQYQFYGDEIDGIDEESLRFRTLRGTANIFNIGVSAEYYFKDFRTFSAHSSPFKLNPFINLGVLYSSYNNTLKSNLGNFNQDTFVLPEIFRPESTRPVGGGSTVSIVAGAGFRYKLFENVDLATNIRYQYFFTDEIEGLIPSTPENTSNDWLIDFQFGVIWHLNFSYPLFDN